jgi:hypothetical protein
MTDQQKSLVRYWFSGTALLVALFSLSGHEHFLMFLPLALLVAYILDKTMRPPRPEGVPTPLEIIEKSTAWKTFFVVYTLTIALVTVLAVSVDGVGSWLSDNTWVISPSVLLLVIGPLIQNQIAQYRAYE